MSDTILVTGGAGASGPAVHKLRLPETRGWMPAALHSDPDIRAPAPKAAA